MVYICVYVCTYLDMNTHTHTHTYTHTNTNTHTHTHTTTCIAKVHQIYVSDTCQKRPTHIKRDTQYVKRDLLIIAYLRPFWAFGWGLWRCRWLRSRRRASRDLQGESPWFESCAAAHIYICTHIYTHIYTCTCIHMHIHTYVHICTHTCTCTCDTHIYKCIDLNM